jgi:hypothetical protein
MDPVSNIDVIVRVLRQRLNERTRAGGPVRGEEKRLAPETGPTPLQALAAVADVDDRQLGRALIQGVLSDYFGPQVINDARFQQVVDRVDETLRSEPEAAALMQRLVRELRASNR